MSSGSLMGARVWDMTASHTDPFSLPQSAHEACFSSCLPSHSAFLTPGYF